MTPEKIEALRKALPMMPAAEKMRVLELLDEWNKRREADKARESLLTFVKRINPAYKIGPHHKILATKLEKAARGDLDRLATAIAPRFGKSLLLSLYFPAWFMGNYPEQKLIISSHTADLAVDFGRKVRNLIDSNEYKSIFQGVTLSADSKSAGRWNTGQNGEFFACIRHHSQVSTTKGFKDAVNVQVGDVLFNAGTPVKVVAVYNSMHEKTFCVAGLECSEFHPVWTMNRGWVYAGKISSSDILRTENFWDKLKAFLRRTYGYLEHFSISTLVQHQVSLRKSPQREIQVLRWTWNFALRAVAEFRQLFCRYGQPTFAQAYGWQEGQQWPIQSRKLPLGDTRRAGEQSVHECSGRGQDSRAKRTGFKHNARGARLPHQSRSKYTFAGKETTEELETYDPPKNIGWAVRCSAWLIGRSIRSSKPKQHSCSIKKHLESVGETAQKLCGFLLGVRPAGRIAITSDTREPFVNFLTDGDHTFFANGVLTHNCGVGGAIAGRGADLLIIDDPFSEQDVLAGNYDVFDKVYEWYAYGARTRLMPGGRVIVLHTRWAKNDLIGRILDESVKNKEADQWEYIEFPAILNEGTDSEKSLWPEQWSLESLRRTRATMPIFQWQAQYQQAPTSQQGALIKKEWWKTWKQADPPHCEYIIMSLDAAQEVNKRADYSALTTWGIFYKDDEDSGEKVANIILLNAINKRIEFPQLKELVLKEYKAWNPDSFIIEKKSNGAPLAQEMRRMGIPIQDYTPTRGTTSNSNSKYARVNAVADIVRSGLVWAPEYKWAEEVIEQCNDFPSGKYDDLCDTVVMALMRFRNGGFITLPSDEDYDAPSFMPIRTARYY